MGVVNQAVQDGVGQRGVADGGMPVVHRKLAGDHRRARIVAVVEDLQEVAAVHVVEHGEPPIVQVGGGGGAGTIAYQLTSECV